MKITCVTGVSFSDFTRTHMKNLGRTDVLVLGFGVMPEINFRDEIRGETNGFVDLALASADMNCAVVAGLDTDIYGIRHRSAAVCAQGKLVDVCDMAHGKGTDYDGGAGFRTYDLAAGKAGLLVDRDVMFPESARALALADCGMLIAAAEFAPSDRIILAFRSACLFNGVPGVMSCAGYTLGADARGEVICACSDAVAQFELPAEKNAELLRARRPELYKVLLLK